MSALGSLLDPEKRGKGNPSLNKELPAPDAEDLGVAIQAAADAWSTPTTSTP